MAAAGEVHLEVLAKDRMRIHYTADGVSGVKDLRRFSFSQPVELANYVGQFYLRQARGGLPYGYLYLQADTLVHFDADTGQGFLRTTSENHTQAGRFAALLQ